MAWQLTERQLRLWREHQAEQLLPGIGAFLAMQEEHQVAYIRGLSEAEAKVLLNALIKLSDTRTIPCGVLRRILEKCDDDEYRESSEPNWEDREALSPANLAKVRKETHAKYLAEAEAKRQKQQSAPSMASTESVVDDVHVDADQLRLEQLAADQREVDEVVKALS